MPKQTHGGARPGAGAKKKKHKKKSYSVSLLEKDKEAIIKKHGSLTKAISKTL